MASDFEDVVLRASAIVRERLAHHRGLCIFKIGITHDPNFRFWSDKFGYARKGELYSDMVVLASGPCVLVADLEARLIAEWRSVSGCRNDAPGGENAPRQSPAYCYLVVRFAGDGRSTLLPPMNPNLFFAS